MKSQEKTSLMLPVLAHAHWLPLVDELDAVAARVRVRKLGREARLRSAEIEALATATTEVVSNVLVHAKRGVLCIALRQTTKRRGVTVIARDWGPGIVHLDLALADGHSNAGGGLGLGLPSARRLVDDFEIESAPGHGTTVSLTKWAP